MGKRRTKAEKKNPHRAFLYSWQGQPEKGPVRHDVKGQFKNEPKVASRTSSKVKNADNWAKVGTLASIKRDMAKSLILASLILAAEVVVYLAWF
ncbi:hypothetical protein HYT60_02465 [Candidatus Woesebacteria bacterium]|nr:hypothetical protein [Candidatus Woesebacteria bacterium]